MKYGSPLLVEPALTVIERADPDLTVRIKAANWTVYAPWDADELLSEPLPLHVLYQAADSLDSDFGLTVLEPLSGKAVTWLNPRNIENQAEELNVPVTEFAANVLVHEFAHVEGADERDAFAESTSFGLLQGQPAIAALSERTAAHLLDEYGDYRR